MRIDAHADSAAPAAGLRVSVVVPTHARAALVMRLLQSLAGQTLAAAAYEVIVVHNFTDDGTQAQVQAWCARQPFRARYFCKDYKGPARSRDFGARAADAAVVAFIDDDCVAGPQWLAEGLAAFETGGEPHVASAASGRPALVQGRTRALTQRPPRFPYRTIQIEQSSIFFETCNIFYDRAVFLHIGGFSPEFLDAYFGEDTDLGWKLVTAGYATAFAPAAVVQHEVFEVTLAQWMFEPARFGRLPDLVRRYPALRRHMTWHYFFSRETLLFNGFVLALLVSLWSPAVGGLLLLAYFAARYRSGAHVGSPVMRIARVVMGVPRGAVAWWSMLRASVRTRTVLL